MENQSIKKVSIILLLYGVFALSFAYVVQFVFHMAPCVLCIYQRIPYYVLVFLTSVLLITNHVGLCKIIVGCCVLTLAVSAGIAFYHYGVEQHIFTIYSDCTETTDLPASLEMLKEQLIGKPAIPCDKPQLVIFGLSMAGWNMLGSICFLLLTIITLYKKSCLHLTRK